MSMHTWARRMSKQTGRGAVLLVDGEEWKEPKWLIQKGSIIVVSGSLSQLLWTSGDSHKRHEEYWRPRIRALVDAE